MPTRWVVVLCLALALVATAAYAADQSAPPNFLPDLVVTTATNSAGATFTILSPYRNYPNVYEAELHCHTTNSDGACTPAELEAKYDCTMPDWIAITDHEGITGNPAAENGRDLALVINGQEHGTAEGHINIFGLTKLVTARLRQDAINEGLAQGALVQINHPEWLAGYDMRELDRLKGYQLIEVFNADCSGGMEYGMHAWDYILSRGQIAWGTATDDFHGGMNDRLAMGYVTINAPELTQEAMLTNLRNGNFYATQGPELNLALDGKQIVVTVDRNTTVLFRGPGGVAFKVDDPKAGEKSTYTLEGNEQYVRVEIVQGGARAWSQPIFVKMGS